MIKNFTVKIKCFAVVILLLGAFVASAQTRTVSGKVTSADDGNGIPGVNILEKGTTNGTATDADGNFKMNVSSSSTLVFTFIGYASQEIVVGERTTIDVALTTDVTSLNEVVVIGYGEIEKKDATGAVNNLSNKDFNRGVVSSPQDLLVGRVAGVSVTSNSGAPGASSTIRIRGGASLSASNDPLIVIDGFPVDNSGLSGSSNPLATLNPNDIESFTVLKDASATAIYGSRASNGVIIVTTKKGKNGKPQFSYNVQASVSTPIKYLEVLNATDYKAMVNDLAKTGVSGLNAAGVAKLGKSDTDWQKEIFRSAITHDHNLSVSGSYKSIPYRVSYGFTNNQGILKNTDVDRKSLNISLTPSLLNDQLKLTLNAKASWIKNNFGDAGAVGAAISFDPTQPVYDNSAAGQKYGGYYTWLNNGSTSGTNNPVAMVNQTDNRSNVDRIIGNAQAEYTLPFLSDLKLNVNVGLDRSTSFGYNNAATDAEFTHVANGTTAVGRRNTYTGRNQSELADVYLHYVKQLGGNKFDVTAGYGWQHFYREGANTNANYDGTVLSTGQFKNENYLVSFFGRLNYSLNGKYLVTATLRNDGSSRFAKENRWGLFPSVAVAWRLKDEAFLSDVDVLSDLKLRGGYGVTGQQDVGNNYPYLATYTISQPTAQYQFGNTFYKTLRPNAYDANLKWESTSTLNFGVDFGLFDDKITGSVEVYQRKTTDLLNTIPIPGGTNFSNFLTTNVGSLENTGFEVTLRATPIATPDFTWNIGANLTRNENKITKLTIVDDPKYTGVEAGSLGLSGGIQNQQVGFPVNSFFVFQQVYNANGTPIEGVYVDRSLSGGVVDGSISNKYRYKQPAANILIGINSRLNYKKFDFAFSGRVSLGNYVYNNNISQRTFYNNVYQLGYLSNLPTAISDTKFTNKQIFSDYYVQNASFFKMDNIGVGYSFDQFFSEKIKARASFTVQNAFIITKYKGIDPEVDGGIDNNIYPRPRVFLVGLNLTF